MIDQAALTPDQYATLRKPLNVSRIAKRTQGNKSLSYLESWDVRAHLIRIFGYCNFDVETLSTEYMGDHEYKGGRDGQQAMVEVIYRATVRLTVRDKEGLTLAVYTESAVGSANGGRDGSGRGDLHDNALKTAASDAMKRCAINLGTQFGLSLYNDGNTKDIVKGTLVTPPGVEEEKPNPEKTAALGESVGQQEKEPA